VITETSTVGIARADRRTRKLSLAAASTGNALEWFDWSLYGILSVYLAAHLFDSTDPVSALLATFAVFAVGFVARPLGGLLFGRLGDRVGRKRMMIVTMTMLAATSVGLALIPDFAAIGAWASILLVLVRLLQGLAHGGEVGVTYTYAAEIAPRERRGLWSSFILVANTVGLMLATATAAILTAVLSPEQMGSFGWRIGFALGGVLGLAALYLRRRAVESDIFTAEVESNAPEKILSKRDIVKICVKIMMIALGSNITFYAWVTFAPSVAISAHGMPQGAAFLVTLGAEALILIALPLLGTLSDRIGRKPMVIAQGILMMALAFPIALLISAEPWTLFVSVLLGLIVWAVQASIFVAVAAEQAPTRVRASILGFIVSFGAAIFGGTGPYLNAWLTSIGMSWVFNVYIIVLGAIVIAGGIWIKETKGSDLS
jgi:MHS family alpha-ketoglutarate permease-like MFS transporter